MSEQTSPQAFSIPEWTLGWRMQRALAHADISVQDMADELGMSRTSLSRWINDKGTPPRSGFIKLWALRTGVPYEWLITGTEPEDGPEGPGTQAEPSSACVTAASGTVVPLRRTVVTGPAREVA